MDAHEEEEQARHDRRQDERGKLSRLEAENTKMWSDFDALKATWLANERAKDAEIERLADALKPFADPTNWDNAGGAILWLGERLEPWDFAAKALEQRAPSCPKCNGAGQKLVEITNHGERNELTMVRCDCQS